MLKSVVVTAFLQRVSIGKQGRGRPKEMLLSGLLATKEGNMDYAQLKERTQGRSNWRQLRWKSALAKAMIKKCKADNTTHR